LVKTGYILTALILVSFDGVQVF